MRQLTTAPTPASPSLSTAPAAVVSQQGIAPTPPAPPATAREMYDAARLRRDVVHDQLDHAKRERQDVADQLRSGNLAGADRAGLEQQLTQLDARVLELQSQYAQAEASMAAAAGLPGAQGRTAAERSEDQFEMLLVSGTMITLAIVLPLVIAFARRIWRRHAVEITLPPELVQRMDGIERAVDATAIEVERIGEGQRFVTSLLANRNGEMSVERESSRELPR